MALKTQSEIRNDFGVFRSAVALKRATLTHRDNEIWSYYELGAEDENKNADPIVFLPGTTTGAEAFFYQLDALSCKGYRCISCQYPPYYSVDEWVEGFERFLDDLKISKVHLFGVSLGGFLAQCYASQFPRRVASMMLANSFTSTASFADAMAGFVSLVHVTPTPMLRQMLVDNFPTQGDARVMHANEWVKERLLSGESLDGYDLASRITLAYTLATVGHVSLDNSKILIVDVNDVCVTTSHNRSELKHRYPDSKNATLKYGGDFPFLASASELTLYLEVHLRSVGLFPLKEQILQEQKEQQQYLANTLGYNNEFSNQALEQQSMQQQGNGYGNGYGNGGYGGQQGNGYSPQVNGFPPQQQTSPYGHGGVQQRGSPYGNGGIQQQNSYGNGCMQQTQSYQPAETFSQSPSYNQGNAGQGENFNPQQNNAGGAGGASRKVKTYDPFADDF